MGYGDEGKCMRCDSPVGIRTEQFNQVILDLCLDCYNSWHKLIMNSAEQREIDKLRVQLQCINNYIAGGTLEAQQFKTLTTEMINMNTELREREYRMARKLDKFVTTVEEE